VPRWCGIFVFPRGVRPQEAYPGANQGKIPSEHENALAFPRIPLGPGRRTGSSSSNTLQVLPMNRCHHFRFSWCLFGAPLLVAGDPFAPTPAFFPTLGNSTIRSSPTAAETSAICSISRARWIFQTVSGKCFDRTHRKLAFGRDYFLRNLGRIWK
jgi:hypothetical protein